MPGDLQFISITDFRPGIKSQAFGTGAALAHPPGVAEPSSTFRCRALPNGALAPLPKLAQTKTKSLPGTSEDNICRISGLHVAGPMQENDNTSVIAGTDRIELHQAYEYINGSTHKWRWDRYDYWDDEAVVNLVDQTINHPSTFATLYRPTAFVDARLHATDETALGDLFVVAGYHPDDMDSSTNIWLIFPDPDAPSVTGTQAILTVNETTIMVQHQGRIVSIDDHVFNHGGSGFWIVNDQLVWTQANLPTVEEDPPGTIVGVGVFTQGPVSGYGAAVSASAQELLLVKHKGGATTISGDLDDPTVFSLPGVTSTRGAVTYGVFTPIGFVYGVKYGGVHVWGGGDASEKISMDLDDDFWMMRPSDWIGFDGKFDTWGDFILCPNNWVYDMSTKSWWRIENPATYKIFQWASAPQSQHFFGSPASFVEGGAVWYRWSGIGLCDTYVWQSQYLAPSIDHIVEFREISLRATAAGGDGTVIVTLTDELGNTQAETFTITSTTIPKLIRKPTSFKGTGVRVKINASAASSNNTAPVIHELNCGYQVVQQEAFS